MGPLFCGLALVLAAQQSQRPPAIARGAAGKAAAKAISHTPETRGESTTTGTGPESSLGLRLGPSRPLRMPSDDETKLANGVRIFVSENREIPIVNVFALVAGGSASDQAGKEGLAEITAQVVRLGGTASLSASELEERLGQLGAIFESSVTASNAQFSLKIPSQSLAAALPILGQLLATPRLDPEAVDTVLGQMHEAIWRRNQSPAIALMRLFRRRLYNPATPWGRTPDYDTLDAVTRANIESFHRQYYRPSQAIIAIEGDIAVAEAKAKAQESFEAWRPAADAVSADAHAPPAPSVGGLLFADREDLRQSGIVVGHLGGRIGDADFAAMQLLCDILVAVPDGRLPARVRANGGWRADWSASWDAGHHRPGELTVLATLDSPFTTQAVTFVKEELSRLRQSGVTEQEVERTRTRLLTRLAVRYQSSAEQARERAVARFHGLPPDLLARTYQSLATLTAAEVGRAAARNLLTEQVVVVAGNSKLFDKQLATLGGKVEPVEMVSRSARPLSPRADAASLEKGRLVLARMQEALGGLARLEAIRNASIRLEGATLIGDRMSNVKLWDRWVQGDVYRQDQEFGAARRAIFYNWKIAWIGVPGSVSPLPAALVPVVRSEMFRILFRLALSDKVPSRQVADLGGGVLQITEGDSQGVRIYLDASTGLPQRILYRLDIGNGASVSAEESLSEWKDFDSIKWPTKLVAKKNGRRSDELTVTEAKFNGAMSAADLEKKP